jgi:hypothetical protein
MIRDQMRQGLRNYSATLSGDGDTEGGMFLDEVEKKLGRYENILQKLLTAAKIPYGSDVTRRVRDIELEILEATEGRVGEKERWR